MKSQLIITASVQKLKPQLATGTSVQKWNLSCQLKL